MEYTVKIWVLGLHPDSWFNGSCVSDAHFRKMYPIARKSECCLQIITCHKVGRLKAPWYTQPWADFHSSWNPLSHSNSPAAGPPFPTRYLHSTSCSGNGWRQNHATCDKPFSAHLASGVPTTPLAWTPARPSGGESWQSHRDATCCPSLTQLTRSGAIQDSSQHARSDPHRQKLTVLSCSAQTSWRFLLSVQTGWSTQNSSTRLEIMFHLFSSNATALHKRHAHTAYR